MQEKITRTSSAKSEH